MQWETVIGLEVHVQLATQSKIFSGASTAYGAEPNTQACFIDLGFPGVLPVLNQEVVLLALKFGLSIQAHIPAFSVFSRKNYFYPDLPKGYQITQHEYPIIGKGHLDIFLEDGQKKSITILRAHLEEDAGKSIHESGFSGIDLNRAGTPLLEIVSAPDMRSAQEAVAYLKTLHALVKYLEISDGNMQEGSFRCDVNVSVRKQGENELGTRTEIKNVNSFRFVERAIQYEVRRQIERLSNGQRVLQETRLYDADRHETRLMRSKEEAMDYRYFPDPDLLPLHTLHEWILAARKALPELPCDKKERFISEYGITPYDAQILSQDRVLAGYFEGVVQIVSPQHAKLVANWIITDLLGALNKAGLEIESSPVSEQRFAVLLQRIVDGTISGKIAKTLFELLWKTEKEVDDIIAEQGLQQVTDDRVIEQVIVQILSSYPDQLADYRAGKHALFGFFVGQVMKAMQGKGNPQRVNEMLREKLGEVN